MGIRPEYPPDLPAGVGEGAVIRAVPNKRSVIRAWRFLVRWWVEQTFAPPWLTGPLAHPVVGYLLALAGQVFALLGTWLLIQVNPGFAFSAALSFLVVMLVALWWGAGPSLLSALVGTLLVNYVLLPPYFSWSVRDADLIGVGVVGLVGILISWIASQSEANRRRAEQFNRSLMLERARLEAILEAIPDILSIHDASGALVQANAAGMRDQIKGLALPLALEQIPGIHAFRTLQGEPVRLEQLPLCQALRGETVTGVELRAPGPNGEERILLVGAAPTRTLQGEVGGCVVTAHDVTALHQAERESGERARLLVSVIETITDGVYVYDAGGHARQINRAGMALLERYTPADDLARPVGERAKRVVAYDEEGKRLPPERFPSYRVLHGEVLSGPDSQDMLIETLDGGMLQLNVSGAPIYDEQGHLAGAVIVARDVTERRQLERRTQASLEALLAMAEALVTHEPVSSGVQALASTAPLAQRVLELSCQVLGCANATFVSRELESDLAHLVASVGFTPEQEQHVRASVEGTRFSERYQDRAFLERLHAGEVQVLDLAQPPYREQRPLERLRQALVVPIHLGEALLGVMSFNQSERVQAYTATELALARGIGRLAGLILERERLLREREEARARALASEETARRMDEFLSIVSHELRTPVTSLKTNIQLVLRQAQREAAQPEAQSFPFWKQLDLFQRSDGQIRRLTRLLDDLLDLSRIRAGRLEFNLTECDLGRLVAEVVEEQRLVHPARRITLERPEGVAIPVLVDADRVGQVVLNYLTNALKYSPADQAVAVRVRVEGQAAKVAVQDAGPGIPLEEQERIWEVFHRVRGIAVQSGSGIGLGLGLHISKTIIERHHGQVGVQSAPGDGATFWFTLPLARTQK